MKTSASTPSLGGRSEKRGTTTLNDMLQDTHDGTAREISSLEDTVNLNARRYNELKMTADRKAGELDKLLDELKDLQLDREDTDSHRQGHTEECTKISALTEEVEKVQKDMNRKLFYQKQLAHMSRRLTQNQMKYDRYVNGMEEAMASGKKEYEDVKLLLRQLEAGKTAALLALQKTQAELEMERKSREAALDERRLEAESSRQIEQWRQKRDQQRSDYQAELRGDLSKEGEAQLLQQLQAQEATKEARRAANADQIEQVGTYEEAFQKIRQATGVRNLDEMVEKFLGQGANNAALEAEKREAEARLAKAKEKRELLHQQFMEMKASGIGSTEINREVYDSMDEEILQARAALKVHKAACERLESVLVAVRQGAMGLAQRLAPFKGMIEHHEELNIPHHGIESLDSLHMSELKLTKMVEAIGQPSGGAHLGGSAEESLDGDAARPEVEERNRPWTPLGNDDPSLSINNLRVKSRKHTDRLEFEQDAQGQVEEGKAEAAADEEDEEEVPSRGMMKYENNRVFNETVRRREQMQKRKQMLERMKDEEGEIDPALASAKMRKKQQAAATKRLAKQNPHKVVENPREDAMSKSAVFLTGMPDGLLS